MFMIVSEYVAEQSRLAGFTTPDPARIAAQVVSGIGFLGAGTILRNRGLITGLTSAASIWTGAAIGLAVGAGLIKLPLFASISVVIMIETFGLIVNRIRVRRFRYVRLEAVCKKEASVLSIRKYLRSKKIVYSQETTENILGEIHYEATLYFRGNYEKDLEEDLPKIGGVRNIMMLDQGVE